MSDWIHDAAVLRELAKTYFDIARSDQNAENLRLHRAVNDRQAERPAVLIEEIPWHEMNINDELTLQCSDAYLRSVEWYLRTSIYKSRYLPADMVVPPYIPVQKIVHSTGIGIEVDEEIVAADAGNHIVAHKYKDILQTDAELETLRSPILTYDEAETNRRFQLLGDMVGDLLPIRKAGIGYLNVVTWDDISRYRGVTNLLMDLAERPDFMHRTVRKLTDIRLAYLDQLEALGLFDNDPYSLHCTPIKTADLPTGEAKDGHLTRKDVWGRGAAQIFASVSRTMHAEFDIEYMKETIGQCGLSYYGCCEPLDKKIDIVEALPNLRKISITPWANVDVAAELINTKYVLSSKPNPAAVAVPQLDTDNLKDEITRILEAVKRHGCSCDIVLKDISTCRKRPQNIFEWEQTVMGLVRDFG